VTVTNHQALNGLANRTKPPSGLQKLKHLFVMMSIAEHWPSVTNHQALNGLANRTKPPSGLQKLKHLFVVMSIAEHWPSVTNHQALRHEIGNGDRSAWNMQGLNDIARYIDRQDSVAITDRLAVHFELHIDKIDDPVFRYPGIGIEC